MRELDTLLLRYLEREWLMAPAAEQDAFELLLTCQDPEILEFLAGRVIVEDPILNHVVLRLLHQPRH